MKQDRYKRPDLQDAYEQGYQQMYDHNAAAFSDRMETMVEYIAPRSGRSEAMAAVYEGGADALRALAARSREAAKVERALRL
jgi:hypothetical protein